MKKALALFLVLLLISMPIPPLMNSPSVKAFWIVVVHVVPGNMTVRLRQPFCVNITFDDLPYDAYNGVTGCEFNVTWNASILQGISMKEIAFHAGTPQSEWGNIWDLKNDVSNGSVLYAHCWQDLQRAINLSYAPLKGSGSWASITFESKNPGETELHFSMLRIGSMTSDMIVGSGIDGNVSVVNILAGDINQDKTVNSLDAIVLSAAFGSVPYNSHWNSDADINGDNIVDIYDALILSHNYGRNTL